MTSEQDLTHNQAESDTPAPQALITQPQLKPLKFFHIPKNAGGSIEECAAEHGILWGARDKDITEHGYDCAGHSDHCPLSFLYSREHYQHLLKDFDWFAVVRNPYQRVVSTFFWEVVYSQAVSPDFDKAEFNRFIREKIAMRRVSDFWAPQVYFIYDVLEPEPNYFVLDKPIMTYILRYENLELEFNALMKLYNLPVRLDRWVHRVEKKYGVADLEPETVKMINEFYREDFLRFGYEMIEV